MVMRDRRAEREAAREAEINGLIDDMNEKELLFAVLQAQLEANRHLKTCATAASIFIALFVLSLLLWTVTAALSA